MGCVAMPATNYSVVIVNGTTNVIDDSHVRFGTFESVGGYLRPGKKATHNFVPVPIPEIASVVWKTPNGESHVKEVQVKTVLPKSFRGKIIFTIQSNGNVRVTNEPFFEMPKNWSVAPKCNYSNTLFLLGLDFSLVAVARLGKKQVKKVRGAGRIHAQEYFLEA